MDPLISRADCEVWKSIVLHEETHTNSTTGERHDAWPLAALVLAFGLVTVALAYRLEDSRLMKVYDELREAMQIPVSS